jgi:hypothetical protein
MVLLTGKRFRDIFFPLNKPGGKYETLLPICHSVGSFINPDITRRFNPEN